VIRRLRTGLLSAGATAAAWEALRATPPGGAAVWERRNHRGEPVTLLEGPAFAAGALSGVVLGAAIEGRTKAAAVLATAGAAGLGAYDDLAGDGSSRGLSGHLRALRRGEVSTGAVKVGGLAVTGLLAAAALPPRPGEPATGAGRVADIALSGALVAGTANLVNLLDLRPGRALKAVVGLGALTALGGGPAGRLAASAVGAAATSLRPDLGERAMLGDTGANAAGALLGLAWVRGLSRPARLFALAAVTGLTLASERVSFSAVIDRTPALRAVDQLGRRPPERDPAGSAETAPRS
jgi:UDP-N-acetylmuramyl pentapeptide phosphotransferase/UDP-N-acetylglucosamine-1-phosphate transferase